MIAFSTTVSALLLNLALAGVVPSPPASGAAKSAAPPPPPPASLSERALTATAEVVGINFGVWAFLHYAGNADYSYISWETIRDNIRDGWEWDRSRYYVNFYHHPYHGTRSVQRNQDRWGIYPPHQLFHRYRYRDIR